MEIISRILLTILVFLTHGLIYFLGRSNGYSKGSHEGFLRAKKAYDSREKASPYLHDTIPRKEKEEP